MAAMEIPDLYHHTESADLSPSNWTCRVVQMDDDSNSDHGVDEQANADDEPPLVAANPIPYVGSLLPAARSVSITPGPGHPSLISQPAAASSEPDWIRQYATHVMFISQTLDAILHETLVYAHEMPSSGNTWPFMVPKAEFANSARVYLRVQAVGEALNMMKLWKTERFSECVDRNAHKLLDVIARHPDLAPIRDTAALYVELTVRARKDRDAAREHQDRLQKQRRELAQFHQKQEQAQIALAAAAEVSAIRTGAGRASGPPPRSKPSGRHVRQRFKPAECVDMAAATDNNNKGSKRRRGDEDTEAAQNDSGSSGDDEATEQLPPPPEAAIAPDAGNLAIVAERECFHKRRGYPHQVCAAIVALEMAGRFERRVSVEVDGPWEDTFGRPAECGLVWAEMLSEGEVSAMAGVLRNLFDGFVNSVAGDVLEAFVEVYPNIKGEDIQDFWIPYADEPRPGYDLATDCMLYAQSTHGKRDSSFGNPCSWSAIGVSTAYARPRKVPSKGTEGKTATAKCTEAHMILGHAVAFVTNFTLPEDELLQDFAAKMNF